MPLEDVKVLKDYISSCFEKKKILTTSSMQSLLTRYDQRSPQQTIKNPFSKTINNSSFPSLKSSIDTEDLHTNLALPAVFEDENPYKFNKTI